MPLWDHSPLQWPRPPYVTWALILTNVVIFIAEFSLPDAELQHVVAIYGVNAPAFVTNLTAAATLSLSPFVALVTSQFLHGNLMHLLGNMIFLWVFGDDVEEAMGPLRFLIFYLGCGVLAALAYVAASSNSAATLIGASGAIAGVLSAYVMFRPCQKVTVFIPWFVLWLVVRPLVKLSAFWVIGSWALIQIWQISSHANDEVAYMAHVGGLAAGAVLFPLMRNRSVRLFECIRDDGLPRPPAGDAVAR
jgi:membrane associated rhomboid family serine protease